MNVQRNYLMAQMVTCFLISLFLLELFVKAGGQPLIESFQSAIAGLCVQQILTIVPNFVFSLTGETLRIVSYMFLSFLFFASGFFLFITIWARRLWKAALWWVGILSVSLFVLSIGRIISTMKNTLDLLDPYGPLFHPVLWCGIVIAYLVIFAQATTSVAAISSTYPRCRNAMSTFRNVISTMWAKRKGGNMIRRLLSRAFSKEKRWYEFRLIFSDASTPRNFQQENYKFIKSHLISTVRKIHIDNFHILNYFQPKISEDLIRFRVKLNLRTFNKIKGEFEMLKQKKLLKDYVFEDYSPQTDAERRIESVRKILEQKQGIPLSKNWKVTTDQLLPIDTTDQYAYAKKFEAFEKFQANILGKWTLSFIEEIDEQPEDKWLVSLFVHLLLNSLGYAGPYRGTPEDQIRKTQVL